MKSKKAIDQAIENIRSAPEGSSVYVGSDSVRCKKNGRWIARYAAVIIVHLASKHGGHMSYWIEEQDDYGNLKQRLINEAGYAIEACLGVMDICVEREFPLEVHLDLNPSPIHKSSLAVKEATGYVLGSTGISPKIKPHSFAASRAADEAAKGKIHNT